ncbi:unnamed protein product [Musa acuminata var. zebrina]
MKPRLPLLRLATALRRAESLLFPPRFRLSCAPVVPQRAGGSLLLEVHSHVLEIFLSKIPPSLCPLSPMRGVGVDSVGEQERHRAVRVLHTKGLDLSCRNWGFPPPRCMPSMRSLCPRSRLPSAQVAVSFVSSCPVLYLLVENQRHQMILQNVIYDQINE